MLHQQWLGGWGDGGQGHSSFGHRGHSQGLVLPQSQWGKQLGPAFQREIRGAWLLWQERPPGLDASATQPDPIPLISGHEAAMSAAKGHLCNLSPPKVKDQEAPTGHREAGQLAGLLSQPCPAADALPSPTTASPYEGLRSPTAGLTNTPGPVQLFFWESACRLQRQNIIYLFQT